MPLVDTPQQVKEVVESTRYPPSGKRGCAVLFVRASDWGVKQAMCNCNGAVQSDLLVMKLRWECPILIALLLLTSSTLFSWDQ